MYISIVISFREPSVRFHSFFIFIYKLNIWYIFVFRGINMNANYLLEEKFSLLLIYKQYLKHDKSNLILGSYYRNIDTSNLE